MYYKKTIQLLKWIIPALAAAFFVYYPITDSDIFWHLASAKEMIHQKAFLFADPFSYTTPQSSTWINLHWFFQLCMYGVHSIGGWSLLLIVKALFLFTGTILLFKSVKTKNFPAAELLFFLTALYVFRYLVPMRPVVFTLLFISLYFYFSERFCQTKKSLYIFILVPIQILWVNTQGLFYLGPILCGCFFLGELLNSVLSANNNDLFFYKPILDKKNFVFLFIMFFVLLAVSVINPYGIKGLTFPFKLFLQISPSLKNIYSSNIIENMPLLSMLGTQYTHYVFVFLTINVLAVFTFAISYKHVRFSHLFCVLCFSIPAYMAQRNLVLYLFALVPFVLWNTDHITNSKVLQNKRLYKIIVIVIAMIPAFCFVQHFRFIKSCSKTLAPFTHPVNSTNYLLKTMPNGNIFNADRYGGYLLWNLYPNKKVFIDTRLSLRTREFFSEYLAIVDYPDLFEPIAKKYNITHVVLPAATVDRYKPLVKKLYNSSNWALAYTDGAEVLFTADSLCKFKLDLSKKSVVDSIANNIISTSANKKLSVEALLYFGKFLSYIDNHDGASVIFNLAVSGKNKSLSKTEN